MPDDTIEIDLQIDELFVDLVAREAIEQHIRRTLSTVAPHRAVALAVVITDDATLQALHRDYLGIDEPTDVLAFSQLEGDAFPQPMAGPPYLGDVIVSCERAAAQAGEYQEPIARELSRLVVHGILHLLGYDDQHATDAERMWAVQESILDSTQETTETRRARRVAERRL